MNQAQLRKAIRDLIKSPNQKTTISEKNPFEDRFHDLYPQYSHYFGPDARRILANRTHNLVHQYNEPENDGSYLHNLIELAALLGIKSAQRNPCVWRRKFSVVKSFGFRCRLEEVPRAVSELSMAANYMAASKWINASLYNLGMLELPKHTPMDPDLVCVVSYLAVPSEFEEAVKQQFGWMMFAEGGTPPELR